MLFAPILELEILENSQNLQSSTLVYDMRDPSSSTGKTFKITAQGLPNSKRMKQDGCVFFGSNLALEANSTDLPNSGFGAADQPVINDVIIKEPYAEEGTTSGYNLM